MSLAKLLDELPIPIVQAPMLGAHDAALAAAVTRAGGLGSLPVSGTAGAEIGAMVEDLRGRTDGRPFAVNLFVIRPREVGAAEVDEGLQRLAPWYERLGVPVPERPNRYSPDFAGQFDALVAAAPPVASFTFDILTAEEVARLHAAGTYVIGTVNTVAEARAWAAVGADGICAQGAEAGGHHGNFLADIEDSVIGTLALTAAVRAAVDLPVIAAGGIMDGAGLAAVLALGAKAAQMGTAFLLSDEATTSAIWREAIAAAPDDPTRLTRAFSGRYARGLENRFMREMRPVERELPAYPVQNRLTVALRAAAAKAGEADMLSLWAGQGVKLARPGDAESLVRRWWSEAQAASHALAARTRAD